MLLVAQASGPVTAGDAGLDGGAGAGVLAGAAGVDGAAGLGGADGLDDEEHPATAVRTISAVASRPTQARGPRVALRLPLPERSILGNTPAPPLSWHMCAVHQV
jgi:hypothetical protein